MFKFVKHISLVLWVLLLVFLGAWFGFENQQKTNVLIFGYNLPSASMGAYLIAFLFFGLILGFFTSFIAFRTKMFKKSREVKQLKKSLKKEKSSGSYLDKLEKSNPRLPPKRP